MPLRTRYAAALLLVLACGDAPVRDADPSSSRPVLRVGTSGDYPPFSREGRGFDIEVAERFAREHGYRLEWVSFRWPELASDVAAGRFDVAMSGVTWRPERAVAGYMTDAVAVAGPCWVGAREPGRVAVNRGGILERWARAHFTSSTIVTVDDNLSLPDRLAAGDVDAFVTDRFEVAHLAPPSEARWCEPPSDRKVYWVAPSRSDGLGAELDGWLAASEPELRRLREQWLGAPDPRESADRLVDLLARRLAFMPGVAAFKRERGRPIEDRAREALLLEDVERRARDLDLDAASVVDLFRTQIELAKRIQARTPPEVPALDLERVRGTLQRLGHRILAELRRGAPFGAAAFSSERVRPLERWLEPDERDRLVSAVTRVRRSGR